MKNPGYAPDNTSFLATLWLIEVDLGKWDKRGKSGTKGGKSGTKGGKSGTKGGKSGTKGVKVGQKGVKVGQWDKGSKSGTTCPT